MPYRLAQRSSSAHERPQIYEMGVQINIEVLKTSRRDFRDLKAEPPGNKARDILEEKSASEGSDLEEVGQDAEHVVAGVAARTRDNEDVR